MRDADKPAFVELMSGVLSFYGKDLTQFALRVWWQACQQFDLDQVSKAFSAHLMDPEQGRFCPMPADIVKALQGTHGDRALVAWGRVYESIRSVGAYQDADLGDPAAHAAVMDMGGWPTLCRSKTDELPFLQKRFCELYRSYLKRAGYEYPSRLAGESTQTNALRGHGTGVQMLVAGGATSPAAIAGSAVRRIAG